MTFGVSDREGVSGGLSGVTDVLRLDLGAVTRGTCINNPCAGHLGVSAAPCGVCVSMKSERKERGGRRRSPHPHQLSTLPPTALLCEHNLGYPVSRWEGGQLY